MLNVLRVGLLVSSAALGPSGQRRTAPPRGAWGVRRFSPLKRAPLAVIISASSYLGLADFLL